jgi:phage terminase small subunit
MDGMSRLNAQQVRFCHEYISDLSVSRAALRAGYSPKNAAQQGSRLLKKPEAAALVSRLHKEKMDRSRVKADRVLQELAQVAFSDVRTLVRADGTLRPIQELSDEAAASIASFEIGQNHDGAVRVSRIKTWDKVAALGQLCRHLGLMAADRVEHTHHVHFSEDQLASMTDDQLSRVEHAYSLLRDVGVELGAGGAAVGKNKATQPVKTITGHVAPA